MIHSSKVLWGEGLFLRPQHFQRQDAYHEWRLAETARNLHPYSWGLRNLKVDQDALQTGILRLLDVQVVMPDGEPFSAPREDELPPSVSLSAIPAGANEMTYYLALSPTRSHGANFSESDDPNSGTRYKKHNEQASDWYTNAVDSELTVLKKRVRLLSQVEPRDHLVSLPLLRVRRNATGGFELDPRFVAPSVSIKASPTLQLQLRRLLDVLQAKVDALYGFHREPSKHIIEFRSGDIASFWLLHTASRAFATLSHLFHHSALHPERLFQDMLDLAGSLLTFSKQYTLADLPAYSHVDPGPGFLRLDTIVRDLLETVISTRYFSISLSEVKPSFYAGRLDSEKISAGTTFYLGVAADMPPAELVEAVPIRFKVGAPDDVEKLVLSAMPGVRITHAPQVPAAIPVRPGHYYFAIEGRGPLYDRMLNAQSMLLYVPAGIRELQLELIALNN